METQSDQSSSQSSDRGSSSGGSSGDSGRGEVGLEVERSEGGGPNKSEAPNKSEQIESREPKPDQSEMPKEGPNKSEQIESREPNQSVQPNRSEAPNAPNKSEPGQSEVPKDGPDEVERSEWRDDPTAIQSEMPKEEPNKSEPIESREPKPGQSEKPPEGPNKSEQIESREPKPDQSEKPKDEPNRTDSGKTVLMTHPINDGKSHPGRGATGEKGHGLDKHPDAKDWYNKAANDLKADAGTKVQAPMGGTVTVERDTNAKHEGGHFGDTVTITNGDFKVVLMHVDARPGLGEGDQKTVKPGEQIGQVTHWDSNPGETHLHVATATKGGDGAYHGVDPAPILSGTQGGNGREVTNLGDGSYVVGDQKYTMPTAPPERSAPSGPAEWSPPSGREYDDSCTTP